MKAVRTVTLPIHADPGHKRVMATPFGEVGDYTLWVLPKDPDPDRPLVYAIINDVLFSVGPKDRVEHSLATNEGRIPLRFSDLKEILKNNILNSKGMLNKVIWEALGLSEAERLSRWEAASAEHARVNTERENARNRQKDAERSALMAKVQKASELVRKGEAVSGPDLISLCQELGIKINPGTQGALKWFSRISDKEGMSARATKSQAVFDVYRKVRNMLG